MYTHIGIVVSTVMEMMPLLELLEQQTGQQASEEGKGIWHYHHTQFDQLAFKRKHKAFTVQFVYYFPMVNVFCQSG